MTMRVVGPKGITVDFPDGTDAKTIDSVMREAVAKTPLPEPNIAHKGDMKPGDRVKSDLSGSVAQGASLGAADEAVAAINATSKTNALGAGDLPTWNERYAQNKARLDAENAATQEAHPIAAPVAELAGGLAVPGLGTAKFIKGGVKLAKDAPKIAKIAKLAGQTARSSAVGAGYSGAYGFNTGTDMADRLAKAEQGAKVGAVVGAAIPPVASAAGAIGKGISKLGQLKVLYPNAAGRIASRIESLRKDFGLNPKDVQENSPDGAMRIVKKMQMDINEELKTNLSLHKEDLNPKNIRNAEHRATVELARKGLANLRNDQKGYATPEELNAINALIGHTQEGRRAVQLAEEKSIVQDMDIRKARGGISRITDELNPFNRPGTRFGSSNRFLNSFLSWYGGVKTGGLSTTLQGLAFGGGRVIDKITGRRSLVELFRQQNLGKNVDEAVDHLPSQFDILRRDRAKAALDKEAARQAARMDAIQRRAEGDNISFDKRKARAAQKEIDQSAKRLDEARAKAEDENKKFDAKVARAQKIAQQEADRQRQAAAKSAEEAPQKAFAERMKLLANARKGVEAMMKQAKAAAKPEMKAAKGKPAYTGRTDASGAPIKSVYNYDARKTEILSLEQVARQKAAHHPADVRKAIEDAVDNMHNHGRGRNKQTERIHFYTEALAKAKTPEDVAAITDALKPLVDVFGK